MGCECAAGQIAGQRLKVAERLGRVDLVQPLLEFGHGEPALGHRVVEHGRDPLSIGELLTAQGLSGSDTLQIITSADGVTPAITDGPFPEAKEFLAGFWIVEVDSEDRVRELAAKASAAPGRGGKPTEIPIHVYP